MHRSVTGEAIMRYVLFATAMSFLVGCSQFAPPVAPNHDDGHDHGHDALITKADVKMPGTFAELVSRVDGQRSLGERQSL